MVAQQRKLRPAPLLDTRRWSCAALMVIVLAACSSVRGPDLERLYRYQRGNPDQPPIVLVPGLFGSRLINADGSEAWPGSLLRLVFSNYDELGLDIDPATLEPMPTQLTVAGLTNRAAGRDYYGRIQEVLENAGGFRLTTAGKPVTADQRRYYILDYDWRQDNLESVRRLDALIEQIRIDYGNPDLKVDVVAHSMGGLITRYYLRYGTVDELTDNEFPLSFHGADRVRRAILLGTPNLGSMNAVDAFINGKKIGLSGLPPEVVATFPSAYQLLPHPISQWLLTIEGEMPEDLDQFDAETWQRFRFSVFDPKVEARILRRFDDAAEGQAYLATLREYFDKQLERARRFIWSLTVGDFEPPVALILFGGDCNLTPARGVVETVDGRSVMRFEPDQIRNPKPGINYQQWMLEPGDGVVTKASLLARQTHDPTVARHRWSNINVGQVMFLCEKHDQLTGNVSFQDNLLHALLSVDFDRP